MLIDCSYFTKGPRQIQNATLGRSALDPNGREVARYIEGYVSSYQHDFLRAMLGEEAGDSVDAYLSSREAGNEATDERYDNICGRLREPFADYVFFQILRDSATTATITGPVVLKSANTPVSPIVRQVSIWNMMVRKNRRFRKWISDQYGKDADKVSGNMVTYINTLNI